MSFNVSLNVSLPLASTTRPAKRHRNQVDKLSRQITATAHSYDVQLNHRPRQHWQAIFIGSEPSLTTNILTVNLHRQSAPVNLQTITHRSGFIKLAIIKMQISSLEPADRTKLLI